MFLPPVHPPAPMLQVCHPELFMLFEMLYMFRGGGIHIA